MIDKQELIVKVHNYRFDLSKIPVSITGDDTMKYTTHS